MSEPCSDYKTTITSFTATDFIIPGDIIDSKNTQGLATDPSFDSSLCVRCDVSCIRICTLNQFNLYGIPCSVSNMRDMVSCNEKHRLKRMLQLSLYVLNVDKIIYLSYMTWHINEYVVRDLLYKWFYQVILVGIFVLQMEVCS